MEKEFWVPSCALSAGLDASLCGVCAHEAEGEASDDSHVLGAMTGSVAGQIILELDIEEPVRALDAPMATDAFGQAIDVEGC